MPENIFLVSSKTGYGLDKLAGNFSEKDFCNNLSIATLKKTAENLKQNQRDLYIIGHTNAGKSSLINALIKDSNRYE